jgi:hypothetical protein
MRGRWMGKQISCFSNDMQVVERLWMEEGENLELERR